MSLPLDYRTAETTDAKKLEISLEVLDGEKEKGWSLVLARGGASLLREISHSSDSDRQSCRRGWSLDVDESAMGGIDTLTKAVYLCIPLVFYLNKLHFRIWGRSGSQEPSVPLPKVGILKKNLPFPAFYY